MTTRLRAVISAMASLGLVGSLAVATPSFAADSASTMLAAITAPMLAMDPQALGEDDSLSTPAESNVAQATLASLVEEHESADAADEEEACLAASVYFEAKGEPLAGQLAVAETVMNRTSSGRFPTSVCGVVRQPGQFSFVRRGQVPETPRESKAWRQAVAVAHIAREELWKDVAPNALYFHASRVSPHWEGTKKIAQLGNHVFYR